MVQSDEHKKNNRHEHTGRFMMDKRNDWMDSLPFITTDSQFVSQRN